MDAVKTTWARIKLLKWPLIGLIVVAAGLTIWLLLCRGCGDQPAAASAHAGEPPPGWQFTRIVKTPWIGTNEASEYTAEFPAGSKVVVVETQNGEQVEIGIMPGGEIVVPDGYTATVYEKRAPLVDFEARPFIGAGYGLGGGYATAGVDLLRVWKLHAGPGVAVTTDRDIGIVGATAFNLWRNVDLRLVGGYGTAGEMAAAEVSIAIE